MQYQVMDFSPDIDWLVIGASSIVLNKPTRRVANIIVFTSVSNEPTDLIRIEEALDMEV